MSFNDYFRPLTIQRPGCNKQYWTPIWETRRVQIQEVDEDTNLIKIESRDINEFIDLLNEISNEIRFGMESEILVESREIPW